MLDPTKRPRLHIRSISEEQQDPPVDERPGEPTPDQEIGELFREMRQATGLSVQQTAVKFNTRMETIGLFEQGRLSVLPPWDESRRVIHEYASLLGLDPEPVLRRVMLQLPGDHPARPRTQEYQPSYDNMRANADAIMNRVPVSQTPIENPSLTMEQDHPGGSHNPSSAGFNGTMQAPPAAGYAPGYGDMRASAPAHSAGRSNSQRHMVAKKRKSGVFVPLVQLLLLLIILGTGYLMWLGVNDPASFEELRSQALEGWQTLAARFEDLRQP